MRQSRASVRLLVPLCSASRRRSHFNSRHRPPLCTWSSMHIGLFGRLAVRSCGPGSVQAERGIFRVVAHPGANGPRTWLSGEKSNIWTETPPELGEFRNYTKIGNLIPLGRGVCQPALGMQSTSSLCRGRVMKPFRLRLRLTGQGFLKSKREQLRDTSYDCERRHVPISSHRACPSPHGL